MTSSLTESPAAADGGGRSTAPVLDAPAAVHTTAAGGSPPAPAETFADRHIGPDPDAVGTMLAALGYDRLEELVDAVVPPSIRTSEPLDVPPAVGEPEVLAELRAFAARNTVAVPMIGRHPLPREPLLGGGSALPPVQRGDLG